MKFILGKKIEMSQKFQDGKVIPVTLINAGPCLITQILSKEKNNLQAIQIGFEKLKENKIKKSKNKNPFRYLRQFRTDDLVKYKLGDKIDVSIFQPGERIMVSGTTKGRGFAGVMKRHGFHGQPATHGTKHDHRRSGSIGSTDLQRVVKGKKMAGRMGGKRKTVKNLEVVEVDQEKNLLLVRGAVPGSRNTFLEIYLKRPKV